MYEMKINSSQINIYILKTLHNILLNFKPTKNEKENEHEMKIYFFDARLLVTLDAPILDILSKKFVSTTHTMELELSG